MKYYLLLGSNIGDSREYIEKAIASLSSLGEVSLTSKIYESDAWGVEDQANFLNQVVIITSELTPFDFLTETQKIETSLDRTRETRWGPRTIDIDILLISGDVVINSETLQIPHKELANRNFALLPLMEVAPDLTHPLLHSTIEELYQSCTDEGLVYLHLEDADNDKFS